MEFGQSMSVSCFDWDDSALIKEYDRIMKKTKNALSKEDKDSKKGNKSSSKRGSRNESKKEKNESKESYSEKEKMPWKIQDYCQAIYHEDGALYEATILDIHGDTCTVEFLGYGDLAEVSLENLEESNGKRARQKQRKRANKQAEANCHAESDADYSNAERETSRNARFHTADDTYVSTVPHELNYTENVHPFSFDSRAYHGDHVHQPGHHGDHVHQPAYHGDHVHQPAHHLAAVPSTVPRAGAVHHPVPPPPMPQCDSVAKDPSMSAMLVSWYMAGYYTGLHQNQKSSHCSAPPKPRCCHCPPQGCWDPHCH